MKITYRIPTSQFAFYEVEEVEEANLTPAEIADRFNQHERAYKGSKVIPEGISTKEFNDALDKYLTDGTGNTELYQAMSPEQKACFQEIKRSYARLEGKNK